MAELFVPNIIDQLTDVAFKQIGERVNPLIGIEEEVKNLSFKLTTITRVLQDAERRKLNDKNVEVWLEKLEDITYEMDDVLDEWNIKIDKFKNLDQEAQVIARRKPTLLKKVRSFIPSLCSCLKEVHVRSDIALKIKEINDKIELSLREANQFNFVFTHSAHIDSKTFKRPMTVSSFDEFEVYGRDVDKKILLDRLLSESTASTSKEVELDEVKVISILGAVGIGKTTLAQMLYNDDKVKKYFNLRKWVCVSDLFDEKRIASDLLNKSSETSYSNLRLETLFQDIKTMFSGRRFLLVFDDVWTEQESNWKPFKDSLKNGALGSIILVTTRKERVTRVVGTNYMYSLDLMSDSDCWLILKQIALWGRSELCERVEEIGQKIAEKCKGLPLAAKTVGSLLLLKVTVEEWEEVLNSEIWQMEDVSTNLFQHFYLSYNELSPQLKKCFSYCAVFPKNTNIDVGRLTRLWMAQGYLGPQSQPGYGRLNVKGRDYFKNLAMRSFFQEFKRSELDENVIQSCKMHDIVHDFTQFLTKRECRTYDLDCQRVETNGGYLSKERVRHLTLVGKTKSINSSALDIGKVRSFLFINSDSELFPQDLFSSLKSVRSLILSECGLQELPLEIGNLIHLRCLDVSSNPLKELPETVSDLYFLESLDVSGCQALERFPQRIGDLVHLRYLLNLETQMIEQMPPGLEKLTSLWNLGRFVADGKPMNNMGKLKHLNQLEELSIYVRGHVNFESGQLEKKIYLQCLQLYFEEENFDIENTTSIDRMKPPPNLDQLIFRNYPRPQLPNWIVGAESNLICLDISGGQISSLPALGKLPSLQILCLDQMWELKRIGPEFYGFPDRYDDFKPDPYDDFKDVVFPSLRKLRMSFLVNWETWEDINEEDKENINNQSVSIMPSLEILEIKYCERLEALPNWLLRKSSSLKELAVVGCGRIVEAQYSDKNEVATVDG